MPVAALLALMAIAMMVVAALRLELHFRRNLAALKARPRPELRVGPAGGY